MLCSSAPASTTPRRAPRKVAGVSTLDHMVEAMREAHGARGCATEDDLRGAGFTRVEIATHGEAASARLRKLATAA